MATATVFKIDLAHAVQTCQALGYKNADNWAAAKVKETLEAKVKEMTDEDKAEVEDDYFDDIAQAVENGREWEITVPEDESSEEAPAKKGKGKGKKGAATTNGKASSNGSAKKGAAGGKSSPAEKPSAEKKLDKFGFAVGTIPSKVAGALTKKPQTGKEIFAKAGVVGWTDYRTLRGLIAKGVVKKEDNTFKLV